ncbi:hypothetical protein D915_009153 [Fasciola hepatica]|uniref:Transcription factor 25 n=1 Tax=Fasciola hepatica TaxID=6192 RepID=A0A4E0QXS9_FASHE|nr:hypothetical protein D915_009153 [Fasciola hepatica]
MSSRALRKLTETSDIIDCQCLSEDSDEVISGSPVASKFSLLRITKDGEILSPQSDSKQHSKVDVAPSKSRKRQRKKNKKKRDQPAPHIDSGDTYMESSPTPTDQSQKGLLAELLTVNTKLLDPFQELSRLFGSHIVGAARTISSADRRSHLKRGLLVRIKPSWPRVVRFGLDMIHTENGEFTFTHSKEYCNTQKSFYTALETMDPNNIMQILASCPYHIDSLLQLSETMMHQDNSEVAIDLLGRRPNYHSFVHYLFLLRTCTACISICVSHVFQSCYQRLSLKLQKTGKQGLVCCTLPVHQCHRNARVLS